MKIIGRIVSRGDVAGLFLPVQGGLPEGIYQVAECMDEMIIQRIGAPAMPLARFTGLDLDGLFAQRPLCCMTESELVKAGEGLEVLRQYLRDNQGHPAEPYIPNEHL